MVVRAQYEANKLKSVGLPVNLDDLQFDDIMKNINGMVGRRADEEWTLGGYLAGGYVRKDWQIGINSKHATYRQYLRYLQADVLSGFVDATTEGEALVGENRRLIVSMEVYVGYSHYGDEGIVDAIKKMGMSKPHIGLAYLDFKKDGVEKAREIIEVCRTTPASKLRAALDKRFRQSGPGGGHASDDDDAQMGAAARAALRHLNWAPTPLIGGKMFVPRCAPFDLASEMAMFCVFDAVRQSRLVKNEETGKMEPISVDELFAEIVNDWINRKVKASVMNDARVFFKVRMADRNQGGTEFPFDQKDAA